MSVQGHSGDEVTYICGKEVPSLPLPLQGHEAAQVTGTLCLRAMASPAPWLRWTQTELTRWEGEEEEEEEEEEEDNDNFERRMDEDGIIGLGEDAGSPQWGDGEELEEGSPVEEGRWHPQPDLVEEERGSFRGDKGPWGTESDGEPYPQLSYEGQWGSGSSSSPQALRDSRALCQPQRCSTDGGDTSDASPGPATSSHRHQGWGAAGGTGGAHGQGWTPSRSLLLHLSTDDPHDATSIEPVPKPQPAGSELPAPATTGLEPTREPWGAGTSSAPQLRDRFQVPKKAAPTVQPPKPGRPSWSLSPRQRHTGRKDTRGPLGTGTHGAHSTPYGRGRLNHPLPDLSKVEARVKFDQSYQPPRGRALPARASTTGPVSFKSPAEIVREVLLSSGEGVPPQPPTTAVLPQEFRSPRQATELVQQLQDDYHKLLTKYAEAENTIDQLRLGARVSLYADPPQPSRSLAVGTVGTGCQVVTLSIPQASMAAFSVAPPSSPAGAPAPGPSDRGGSPQPPCPPPPRGVCPTCPGPCCCSGARLTQTLAGQTLKLQAQVESFEGWVQAGGPVPREQLQRFRKLKDAQDALERAYLQARQQHPGVSAEFDPDRGVEGAIFHLGLRLEELKDRLEPGARWQPPAQHPAQPCSPPAPSAPPATGSLCPQRPRLMEGPQGTAGDSEVVTGGLPQPLWHKQRRVEEDFGGLLEQYKHFKSLPESLSLEQLSLAGSRSQEEADGPAAGDSGPSNIPGRTQALEKGADLKTSPLHPLERRATLLPPREPSWPGGTGGHLSPTTAEELPAAAKPPLGLPEAPRPPLSRRSSRVGGAANQHQPSKEQRIVSPETDSGFMGSEASRVSPPMHTPEHRPPGTRTPHSLGLSIPMTLHPLRKREVTPLPSETTVTGIYPSGGQGGTEGPRLPPSTPSQSSSPHGWAESTGSEVGPDAHTDSEAEGRSCASAACHPPSTARGPASPPPAPKTPSPPPAVPHPAVPCQAIRALRDEVWQLQRRLEESLRRSRTHPQGKATPARRHPVANRPSSPKDAASSGELSPPVRGRAAPRVAPTRRGRSASLPRERPELDLSKWDPAEVGMEGTVGTCSPLCTASSSGVGGCGTTGTGQVLVSPWDPAVLSPRPDPADPGLGPTGSHPASLSSASDPSPSGPQAAPSPRKSPGSPPGVVTFRGQYTGTWYQAVMPPTAPAPQEKLGTPGCPRCHGSRTLSAGFKAGNAARQPQHSTPRRTRCPTCQAPMGAPASSSRDGATHAEPGPTGTSPSGPHVGPQAKKPEQPRLWYCPGATAAVSCLAPVPLVPYVPSVLYCSPAVPTSAPAVAGVPLRQTAGHGRAEHPLRPHAAAHRRCLTLGLEELEELNWSLSQAMEAAQSVRLSTTRMSRVLAAELSRARDLRGSCLF
ncbi:microtubule organization protein AKNA [Falco biarmicus]|uniref:microtubule organization protein AKNA n=1 Tax=Falco biarmicus TaxID=345155 RepID=UPI0024BC60AB|nr:microtubule organization protein AKNA [Falco biarmicus]